MFSQRVLIGRGLDLKNVLFSFDFAVWFSGHSKSSEASNMKVLGYAPLAQLVEHLTLNQGVQGSSP